MNQGARRLDGQHAMLAEEAFGPPQILVNNAGIQADAPFVGMTFKKWQRVLDVNLTGQFLYAREAARVFSRVPVDPAISTARGKIICMSSVHQTIPWTGHANYAASKGGVMLLMQTLAQELAPARVRVNAVTPGAIKTSINRRAWEPRNARPGCSNASRTGGSTFRRLSRRRWCGSPLTIPTTSPARRSSSTAV